MAKKNKNKDNLEEKETEKTKPKRGNPHDIVQIYDTTCNKIRQARNFKVSSYEETDINGNVQVEKSVECIIVGNNRTWKMFFPFDEFIKSNPEVSFPGE